MSFWRGRRVLLTGHTGFKGSWLALQLADLGADVVGYANGVPTEPALYELADVGRDLVSVTGDVRDAELLRRTVADHKPEVVFHLAAQALVRASYEDPAGTFAVNVLGTVNLLEAVRAADDVRVVVNVTTDKVYAPHVGGAPYTETEPLGGHDPYSTSKAASELVTSSYRVSFPEGATLATARAGNVIGGGDWAADRLIPDLMRGALGCEPVVVRNPRAVRPWQHVLNANGGYLLLAEKLWDDPSLAGAWNFGPDADDAVAVSALAARLSELWGSEIELLSPDGAQPHEAEMLRLDSSRARSALGWRPQWDLDRALTSIVDWYRALAAGGSIRDATLAQIHDYSRAPAAR
ncbi:MAG TPA: CDP-glucose 4,6-dehydratase [Gaiellaceae bacterium]